jgi:hypothetical protein
LGKRQSEQRNEKKENAGVRRSARHSIKLDKFPTRAEFP